ncbi:hypothetical protein OE749_00210 [Aestuariibacter sp. AA17]|uniref:Chromosome partition protein Smc n=1 Tax=Fluctibacter corallii TaxID=2984329 RepID=A0ABT3A4E5_9ALTE|nr:hypothetical protein [Aestuariibacter sp. AA17]MCV2883117.1 hypothetical protein [Aestuariibacter sp. AA17]
MPNNFDGDFPPIKLDQEDRDAYQKARTQSKIKSTSTDDTPSAPAPKSNGFLVSIALLVALGSSGACYWLYTQNAALNKQVIGSEQRIEDLEQRLSATGEEMDQSAVAMQVKVSELSEKSEELWRQMDKLWASAWRRNQSDIKELATNVQALENNLNGRTNDLASDIATNNTNFTVLQEQLNKQRQTFEDIDRQIASLAKQDSGVERQFGDIKAKLIAVDQVTSAISRRLGELEKWQNQQKSKSPVSANVPVATTSLPSTKPNN